MKRSTTGRCMLRFTRGTLCGNDKHRRIPTAYCAARTCAEIFFSDRGNASDFARASSVVTPILNLERQLRAAGGAREANNKYFKDLWPMQRKTSPLFFYLTTGAILAGNVARRHVRYASCELQSISFSRMTDQDQSHGKSRAPGFNRTCDPSTRS